MTDSENLLVIIRHAPYSSNLLREGLDAALVAAAFGQPVDLLFLGQGIMALVKEQGSGAPGQKASLPTMDMLEMYDIENLWTSEASLAAIGVPLAALRDNVRLLKPEAMPAFMQQYSHVLNF